MQQPIRFRASYTGFAVLLALALMLLPMLDASAMSLLWIEIVIVAAVLGALWQLHASRLTLGIAVTSAVASEVGSFATIYSNTDSFVLLDQVSGIVFLGTVVVCVTRNVWNEERVTADTIVGGLAVYLLIGTLWSMAYQLLEFLVPGSLVVVSGDAGHWGPWEAAPGKFPRLFFFSFVTLTTLGYGDIVPASAPAASLAMLESVLGPIYLTVLIARLVALEVAHARSAQPPGPPPTA